MLITIDEGGSPNNCWFTYDHEREMWSTDGVTTTYSCCLEDDIPLPDNWRIS